MAFSRTDASRRLLEDGTEIYIPRIPSPRLFQHELRDSCAVSKGDPNCELCNGTGVVRLMFPGKCELPCLCTKEGIEDAKRQAEALDRAKRAG